MATRTKQDEDEDVERDEEVNEDEEQDGQGGASLSLQVYGDTLVIELPRDGNESDTLQRLAKFADGL
jgi:hypothetical protein